MDRREACGILGVEDGDKLRDVRRKYHRLMHVHHPDTLPVDSDISTAQRLNEAFEVIKREGLSSKIKASDWGIKENARAYCDRKLYMEDNLFGDEIIVDTGAYGKYYWEPDMESFRMLLKSLGEAVNEILDGQEKTDGLKAKLLHLLIQEFIDPYECIGIIYPYEEDEGSLTKTFRIRCQIKTESPVKAGLPENIRIKAEGSRLYVFSKAGPVGRIMFEEDRLYYLVTPFFLQNAATAELITEKPENSKKSYIDACMILHVDPSKRKDMTERINEEIRAILKNRRSSEA